MSLCVAALVAALLLTAYFRPSWLKAFVAGLIRFTEAMQAFRAVIDGPAVVKLSTRKPGPVAAAPIRYTSIQGDVISALVNMGDSERQAQKKVSAAIASLPANAGFDDLFRKAVAA